MGKKDKKAKSKGFSPKIYKGLNDKRMAKGQGGNRLVLKQGDTATVQFCTGIEEFREFDVHTFQDRNRWNYIPCAGDDCPLCDDEDPDVSKTSYRFCCNVYSKKEKKVLILEGPKDLSGRIALRYKNNRKKFTRKLYDVSKLKTTPVSYDVESADGKVVDTSSMDLIDLDAYITAEMERYFGDATPVRNKSGKSALDDDDDDDDADEDEYDEDELLDMEKSEVKRIAKSMKIKTVDSEGEPLSKKKLVAKIIKKQG